MDEGKKIFDWWLKEHDRIMQEAIDNGPWKYTFDGNQYLFKALNEEAKEKLKKLKEKQQQEKG